MVKAFANKIKRSIAYLTATPFQSRWLNKATSARLQTAIAQAEKGHNGELVLVIEKSLPMSLAWNINVRERAVDLFSHYRVWDTVERSGVLIYLNLAEHRLEIVADRGIDAVVADEEWQRMADDAIARLYAKARIEALEILIDEIAQTLRTHFAGEDVNGNELPDRVIII